MRQAAESLRLASFLATATMVMARPILMPSSPPRPLTDERGRRRSRPDEAGEQMTSFTGGQRDERGAGRWLLVGIGRMAVLDTEVEQEGGGQQDKGHMPIPAQVTAYFVVIQAQIFADF